MNNLLFLSIRTAVAFILCLNIPTKTSAQRIDSLYIPDTRSIASVPGNYSRSLKANFKYSSVIGLAGVETYSTVIGFRGWVADNSGGKAYELAFANEEAFLRSGLTAGWGSWKRLLTNENIKESNGNVGIGTSDPQSKLAVDGTVTAKQVKVTQTGWPDYVFDTVYRLPDLSRTETFLKAYHHLPGIPSAKEIEIEGLDLGEMQKKQMQKIEEFTLYIIRLNKKMALQDKKIEELIEELKLLKQEQDES